MTSIPKLSKREYSLTFPIDARRNRDKERIKLCTYAASNVRNARNDRQNEQKTESWYIISD